MSTTYQVINRATQAVVGTYSTMQRARSARERKDLAYGAAVHVVRPVITNQG